MAFQTVTNVFTAVGVPGEAAYFGPEPRVQPRIMYSGGTNPNTMGFAFTESTVGDIQLSGTVTVGGTGQFAGILVQPKASSTFGTTAGGPLAATLNMPDYSTGEMLSFGDVFVALPAAANIGDLVAYNTTTGTLTSTAPTAAFTASQSTTVLTVSAITAGNLGVGTQVYSAGVLVGTIISLGTGTGGTGTYNMNTSATVSSAAMTAASVAASGTAFVPKARVNHFPITAAGVAVVTLSN